MKRWKIYFPVAFILFSILLNAAARIWKDFGEYYVNHIFPIWVETYGRLTGIFSFSVGEWLLYLAVLLVAFFVICGMIRLLFRKQLPHSLKKHYKKYALVLLWIFGIVCIIMTLNCFLLYQGPSFNQRFPINQSGNREYGSAELAILRDYVVEQSNLLAPAFERDKRGNIVDDTDYRADARREMQKLGEKYPGLNGYYPNPKPLCISDFYCQQYILGYYFPFSMEANYNSKMYVTNIPVSMCHELSHLKGFIFEDEANFIGYLACVDSKNPMFRYSAYLSVIGYLDNAFIMSLGEDAVEEYYKHPQITEQVINDTAFLTEETWADVEENAVLDTEMVEQATNSFLNTTLTLNGVEDGTESYSRVVELLLQYYDGTLY